MNSWTGYSARFLNRMSGLALTTFEKVLIGSLVLMCLISALDSWTGRDDGNYDEVKMAKFRAQQELMALRTAQPE